MSRYFTAVSADGTRIRGWTNDAADASRPDGHAPDGDTRTPLVLSNGLGGSPVAWPSITSPDSGFRVVTWFHRGLNGSERPADPAAVRVEDHTADMEAVMAAAGVERGLVVAWSIGVNVAFDVALRNPSRVAGLLGVAGVPGGSLGTMYGSVGMPAPYREPAGRVSAQMLRITGPWLSAAIAALPRHSALSWSGGEAVVREAAHLRTLSAVLREFADHDWDWYSKLVLAAGEREPMDVSAVRCPVTLLAGRHDAVTSSSDMVAVGRTIPGARVTVLPAATHLLPLQYPELILAELRLLAARADR